MITRFGYPGGILAAPPSLIEAHEMEWVARRQADADNARDAPK